MFIDPLILPAFLSEAESYLRTLRNPTAGLASWRRAIQGLYGAAAILEFTELMDCALRLEMKLVSKDFSTAAGDLDQIEQLLEQVKPDKNNTELPDNRAPSIKQAPPSEEHWDTETAQLLQQIFQEEARTHLDAIANLAARGEQLSPTDIEEILRKAHTLKGSAHTVGLSHIGDTAHRLEELLVTLQKAGRTLDSYGLEQLNQVIEYFRLMVASVGKQMNNDFPRAEEYQSQIHQRLNQLREHLLSDSLPVSPPAPSAAESVSQPVSSPTSIQTPLSTSPSQLLERRFGERRFDADRRQQAQRVQVDAHRIEEMMNAVGELVVYRSRIERRIEEFKELARDLQLYRGHLHEAMSTSRSRGQPNSALYSRLKDIETELSEAIHNLEHSTTDLTEEAEALHRTSTTLQENLSQIRLMPIQWLHTRLQQPLREIAQRQGKIVTFSFDHESSGMDRALAEQINDILIQLLRNAVVHGIEAPETRRAKGKPEQGHIRLSVRHEGDFMSIAVEDDGAGINPDELRLALKKWGKIEEQKVNVLSDQEILDYLFVSGLSTRQEIDQWAGRGVGLDVVRQNIQQLGGSIHLRSQSGVGTCFTIQIPLTTAISQALLFRVGQEVYAIPVVHVAGILNPTLAEIRFQEGYRWELATGEKTIPILNIHGLFKKESPLSPPSESPTPSSSMRLPIIVLRTGNTQLGITSGKIIGPREIVLKPLGRLIGALPLFAGATVSGSNKVQFVFNVVALARMVSAPAFPLLATTEVIAVSSSLHHATSARILVADDSRSIREVVTRVLQEAGYQVDAATDGWEAWELLHQHHYHLLLTDLEMPHLHGNELIAKCRKNAALRELPIMVITSRTAERNRELMLQHGANAFMAKPISRRVLLAEVKKLLHQ